MHLLGNGAIHLLGDGPMHLFDYIAIGVLIACMVGAAALSPR
jgi:hypothetical protein